MADLYNVESPIDREQRNNLNLTFEDILKRFSNLQRQINILAGDNDVDELINRIADTLTNSEATLSDLQTALTDAQQVIDDMITATTNATNATEAANQATADTTQLFNDMTALQTDLEVLQTSLNQIITDANQATAAANTATNNANQAAQDAQQATTDADNAASRANDAVDSIEGWGQAAPYQSGTYDRNNVVTYEGSTYQSLVDDNTSLPTDNSKWIVLARKGLDGQGAVSTVNDRLPDEHGNVELGISDIDGLEISLNEKASDEKLTTLEQTVTQHLDEKNVRLDSDSFGRIDARDEYTAYSGSSLGKNFIQRLAKTKNLNVSNYAVGGAITVDAWKRIKSQVPIPSTFDMHFLNIGYNDIRTNVNKQGIDTGVAHQIKAIVAFLRLASIVDNKDSRITYSGAWQTLAPFEEFYSSEVAYTEAAGAFAQFNFSGNAITIGTVANSQSSTYEIYVDTKLVKTVSLSAPVGHAFVNTAIELTNLGEGSHTLKIVRAGTGNMYLDWIGIPATKPPIVWVNGITKMLTQHYTAPATSAITDNANIKIRSLLSEFDERVVFIEQKDFDPNLYNLLESDGFHPNDFGHEWIASNILKRWSVGVNFS